jgi:SAM-dependent methyltransferase
MDLPFEDGTFDVVLSNAVINYLADPVGGLREQRRVARPGGKVLAYVADCRLAPSGLSFNLAQVSGARSDRTAPPPCANHGDGRADGLQPLLHDRLGEAALGAYQAT